MTSVRISSNPDGTRTLTVGGQDLSNFAESATLYVDRNSARLSLVLQPDVFDIEADATIGVPTDVAVALVAGGWTPPGQVTS